MGPVLFHGFITDVEHCSRFADGTKLSGAVGGLEGRDATQRDLGRLKEWAHVNHMRFKKATCKTLHLPQGNP